MSSKKKNRQMFRRQIAKGAVEQLMDNITVLIVDDSSVMRKIVERSLRQAGIEIGQVFEAGNGLEALAVLNERKVNLVLCDINMPAMDGLEFVKQLPKVENAFTADQVKEHILPVRRGPYEHLQN